VAKKHGLVVKNDATCLLKWKHTGRGLGEPLFRTWCEVIDPRLLFECDLALGEECSQDDLEDLPPEQLAQARRNDLQRRNTSKSYSVQQRVYPHDDKAAIMRPETVDAYKLPEMDFALRVTGITAGHAAMTVMKEMGVMKRKAEEPTDFDLPVEDPKIKRTRTLTNSSTPSNDERSRGFSF